MSELKPLPCPFCGGINIINCGLHKYCHSCGAEGPDADNGTDAGLLSAWNRRAQPAQAGQVLTHRDVLEEWTNTTLEPCTHQEAFVRGARWAEQAVLAKRVPMTEVEKKAAKWDAINAVWVHKEAKLEDLVAAILRQRIEEAEHHGIGGEKGGA